MNSTPVLSEKSTRGLMAHHTGLAAEEAVLRVYLAAGYGLLAQRWRGKRGEIDLIFSTASAVIMVEVKAGRTLAAAAMALSGAQSKRLYMTAQEYMATLPNGGLTDIRFDVALVDQSGRLEILENAFA